MAARDIGREVLLIITGIGWLAVILGKVARNQSVGADDWASLPTAATAVLAVFRADARYIGRRRAPKES